MRELGDIGCTTVCRQTQILQLNDGLSNPEHYYIHVIGKAKNQEACTGGSCADFDYLGSDVGVSAPLDTRPRYIAPILTPHYDEEQHWLAYREYRRLLKAGEDPDTATPPDTGVDPIRPVPTYTWNHRPEYQFSRYSLEIDEINRVDIDPDTGAETKEDIYDTDTPVIGSSDDLIEVLYSLIGPEFDRLTPIDGGQNLILAIGEHETRIEMGEDNTLRFDNIEHLAGLDPEDFLSMRLYLNQDAGNILWEYALGSEPALLPLDGFVNADQPEVEMLAYLPQSASKEQSVKLRWIVEGNGTVEKALTESVSGAFANTLTTTNTAGHTIYVTLQVVESDNPAVQVGTSKRFGPFNVIAGAPARIELNTPNAELLVSGVDTATVTANVYDAQGNPVADGTPVDWKLTGDGEFRVLGSRTENGQATVEYEVGKNLNPSDIVATSDRARQSLTVEKRPLEVSLNADKTVLAAASNDTVNLTVSVNEAPSKPVTVNWYSSRGHLIGDSTLTGTTASASLRASELPGDGFVAVNIAGVRKEVAIEHRAASLGSVQLSHNAIVGAAEGTFSTVETLYGSESYANVTETTATVRGIPGTSFTLRAGGFYTPNSLPVLNLAMNELESEPVDPRPYIYDYQTGQKAYADGEVDIDRTHSYTMPGASLKMAGGHLTVSNTPELNITDNLYVNLRVRPGLAADSEDVSTLARQGNSEGDAYALELVKAGSEYKVRARVTTDSGTYTVTSSQLISEEEWAIVGITFSGGALTIGVNHSRDEVNATGSLLHQSFGSRLSLGESYIGHLDDVRVGHDTGARALVALGDGAPETSVTIGADGTATVSIKSTGTHTPIGQRIGLTATYVTETGQLKTRELRIARRVLAPLMTLLAGEKAYAQGVDTTSVQEYEDGVAVVNQGHFAQTVELMKQSGAVVWDYTKQALEFLYEMSGFADLYTIGKAIYLWLDDRFDEVDKFDLVFAGVGLTLSVVAIVTSPTGAGTGAALSLKAALKGLKATLKELVADPALLLKAGGVTVTWTLGLLKEFVSGNAASAAKRLTDLGDLFVHMLSSGGQATLQLFTTIVDSAQSFSRLMRLFVQSRRLDCGIADADGITGQPPQWLIARLTGAGSLIPVGTAYADTTGCVTSSIQAIKDKILDSGRYGNRAQRVADEVADIVGFMGTYDVKLTADSIERLGDLADANLSDSIRQFLEHAADASNGSMKTFILREGNSTAGLGRVVNDGQNMNVMDHLLEAVANVPGDLPDAQQFMKGLTIRNDAAIRGVYGEASSVRTVMERFSAISDNQPVRLIQSTDWVKVKRRTKAGESYEQTVQGIDQVYELGDSRRKLYVESKLLGAGKYNQEALEEQFRKHLETKILYQFRDEGFGTGVPLIHYELRGSSYTSTAVQDLKDAFSRICKEPKYRTIRGAGFDCDQNISIEAFPNTINPFIN